MTAFSSQDALAFVRRHGVVLVSAKGRGPNLVEAIAGEVVKGSWWGRADGKHIFAVLSAVTESDEVLVCRLVDGKVTLVHRRLWPALVRLADAFARPNRSSARRPHGVGSPRQPLTRVSGLGAAGGDEGRRSAGRGGGACDPRGVAARGWRARSQLTLPIRKTVVGRRAHAGVSTLVAMRTAVVP